MAAPHAPDSARKQAPILRPAAPPRTLPYQIPPKRRKDSAAKRMAQRGRIMAKGMSKPGKNVKKPKKEKAQTTTITVPSTKNSVNISGGKPRD